MTKDSDSLAELCSIVSALNTQHALVNPTVYSHKEILEALNRFMECVRYLNTRRSSGAVLHLESEADVQDAVYLMLRAWIEDLTAEHPTGIRANRFSIEDFLSEKAKTIIEVKFIRDASHAKSISKELHDDIEMYRHHPNCKHLIFFIYDPDSLIPNVKSLEDQIQIDRVYAGVKLQCYILVKP